MKKFLVTLLALFLVSGSLAQGITVWTIFGDSDLDWLQAQATSFEAAFGTSVTITRVDLTEVRQRMLLSAPQGEAADLIVPIPHDQLGEMAAGGVLADMSGFATASYLADLSEQARLAFTFGGSLFGLPMYVEGPALIVNTDLVPVMPDTFEGFLSMMQDMTSAERYGFLYDIGNFYFSFIWLNSMGGYVFERDAEGSLDPTDIGLANEGAIAGGTLIRDLRHQYNLIPPGIDTQVAEGLFLDGSLAAAYNGPWAIANIRSAGVPVAVYPVPPMADGTPFAGFMGVQGILMNEFSNNKVDAANFAKWVTRPDAQVDLARRSGRIPSSINAAAQVADDPIIAGFANALANATPMPNIPEMGAVWGPMGDALTVILESPTSDVAAILERAVQQIRGN